MGTHRLLALASVAPHTVWFLALSVIVAASLAGCPGTLDNPSQFSEGVDGSADSGGSGGSGGSAPQCDIPVASVPEQLFAPTCGTSSCHDASVPAGELDLVSPGVEGRLLDKPSSQCTTETLVDTTTPANSFLLEKVSQVPDDCGDRMPLGGVLPPEKIACVRDWIDLVIGNGGPTDAATDSAGD